MQHSFFFQAMVYLASAVVMVPIAKKLGLGSVLGYLLAGILIGPSCLEFIGQEGTDIMHFAEFGVVIMLFVIGLELEPSRLWRLRKSILGMGGVQVGGTSVVVAGLAMAFGIDWKQSLALGMITAMSSTAIVLQSLNEKGLMKTPAGQSSFSVLLFQDIAVIPMLALFPLLATQPAAHGEGGEHGGATLVASLPSWLQPIVVLSSVAAVVIAGRYATPPLFRIIARTGMREMFTATALLLVVGIAVLMTTVGLSPALGTFLAGVVLANSEYRHELESDIDPFKGLLLGLFFIAVGASIDFSLVLANPWLILGLVFGIMLCKLAVLFVLGKSFSLSSDQNAIFSFGLCQIGEFAFVLFSFSSQEGILSKEITDTMTAVVAISMAFTPLVMLINEKLILPRLGLKEAKTEEPESDIVEQDNEVIIVGYGHFGSTVGRFLQANNVGTTVLDSNGENVYRLRKMGYNVFYGDASRHDLLEIAGAAKAKVIVIAIADEEKRLELIETVKKHFPELHILVRSTNRYDAYDLMNAGMLHIYRETFDTSLRVGVDALTLLGHRAHEANRAAKMFFRHDERTLKRLSAIRNDDEYFDAVRQNQQELDRVIQADRNATTLRVDEGWDEDSLIAENRAAS
ncbi:monovalent cation:proton antiporter-2 (CPA2) family protein [Spirosoma sp. SC4-14]|uniref:monovalent cation:proton antiporter-2 (CPA2) family protein n=1 Tax=Spirosoma sp. SC4-14 TaxID=3128900 RepID=UPI0030CF3267